MIIIPLFIEWEVILGFFRYLTPEHVPIFYLCLSYPHWCHPEISALAIMMNYRNGHGQTSWSPWVKHSPCIFKDITGFQEWMSPAASPILCPEQPKLSLSNSLPSVTDSFLIAFIHLKLPQAVKCLFFKGIWSPPSRLHSSSVTFCLIAKSAEVVSNSWSNIQENKMNIHGICHLMMLRTCSHMNS